MLSSEIERLSYLAGSYSLLIYILGAIVVLLAVSVVVKDVDFMVRNPILFTGEIIMVAVVATVPFTYLYWSRSVGSEKWEMYVAAQGAMTAKFAILHILLQTSGFYTLLFVR
jgi:sulfite exporter TauE/SafE